MIEIKRDKISDQWNNEIDSKSSSKTSELSGIIVMVCTEQ
jgi:hypothetical protein